MAEVISILTDEEDDAFDLEDTVAPTNVPPFYLMAPFFGEMSLPFSNVLGFVFPSPYRVLRLLYPDHALDLVIACPVGESALVGLCTILPNTNSPSFAKF
jgi:hypothetical protein